MEWLYDRLIYVIESVLGVSTKPNNFDTKGDIHCHCPFCHHHKKKLYVNVFSGIYHCWICGAKGRSLIQLFYRLNTPVSILFELRELIAKLPKHNQIRNLDDGVENNELVLPKEFTPLWIKQRNSPEYNHALNYLLTERNLTHVQIKRYNLGYCEGGLYDGRIVVPSYDKNGKLNYFSTRTYRGDTYKYKNPPVHKNIIGFESHINWKYPITIVEGGFDAISFGQQAIPIFGTELPDILFETIVKHKKHIEVSVCLDPDAIKKSTKIVEKLYNEGIERVKHIHLPKDKDPGNLTRKNLENITEHTKRTTFKEIIKNKLVHI